MASEILGLFTSPEQYQQQQDLMMQRQAAELAQLDPYQSIRFGAIRAGQQFGRGLAGALGAEDPQLRMISARQSALQGINLNDPESIFTAAQQLADAGDQQGALMLADYGRKAASDAALVTQRERGARAAAAPKELLIAEESARLQDQITQLEAAAASPERDRALNIARNTLARLTTAAKPGQVPDAIEIARELALEAGAPGTEEYNKSYRDNLKKLSTKDSSEKQLEFSRLLQEAGFAPGTPDYQAKMRAYIDAEITGRKTGKGTQVDLGGIRIDTGEAAKKAGGRIGEELVDVKNKESALDSISDALGILKKGIYGGAYGEGQKLVAKYTGIGDKDKVARTEEFGAYIGDVVIPRLKDFGGSDSNEELKYLNRITGGELDMEPAALRRILERAEVKIKRGIERLRRQAESTEKKQTLTSTLPPPETPAPAVPAAPAAPRPTKRWNPNTRRLEAIQ